MRRSGRFRALRILGFAGAAVFLAIGFKTIPIVLAVAPTINNTANSNGNQCSLTVASSGDIIILGIDAYSTANDLGITGIAGTKGDSSYASQTSSTVIQMTVGGLWLYSFIYTSTTTGSGTDLITITRSGTLPQWFMYCYDTSGLPSATAAVVKNANAVQATGNPATASATYANNNILIAADQSANGCAAGANPTLTAGTGYTLIQNGVYEGSEYQITSGAGTTTFPYSASCNTGYGISGAVFGSSGTTTTRSPSTAIALSAAVIKSVTLLASTSVSLSPFVLQCQNCAGVVKSPTLPQLWPALVILGLLAIAALYIRKH